MCVEFRYLLKAWHSLRQEWHRVTPCRCSGCRGPRYEAYRQASKSLSDFRRLISCARQPYPHLVLPHLPGEIPEFYPLKCCGHKTPTHIQQCSVCGWDEKFYSYHNCIERADDETATWFKWQQTTMLNEKDTRPVLREYTGTRLELLLAIQGSYSAMINHCWINEMTRHQEKLDVSMLLCVLEVPIGICACCGVRYKISIRYRLSTGQQQLFVKLTLQPQQSCR